MPIHGRGLGRLVKWRPRRLHGAPLLLAVTLVAVLAGGGYALSSHSLAGNPSFPAASPSRAPHVNTAPVPGAPEIATAPSSSPTERSSPGSSSSSPILRPVARLCGQAGWPEKSVAHGTYIVQNDEWNSTAPECITTDGGAQFTVASSSIREPAGGDPGGYPAIYSGCSAGVCTAGSKLPIQVRDLGPGVVTSDWATTQPSSGAYDVAYDIWFNHTPSSAGAPDGGELMIWLAHRGGSQIVPGGQPVAHVTIGGFAYTVWVWHGNVGGGPLAYEISYVMDRPAASVRNLDIGAITSDAVRRGYLNDGSYLLSIQAGFELWQGGAGLRTNSFGVDVKGSGAG